MNNRQRKDYVYRINGVIDYIEGNIDSDLSLDTLAEIADFSPFHFHRIFRVMVGETLNQFVQRVRVERAASKLIAHPNKSITEIAFECGYSGSAVFARAFREAFQMSASEWRAIGYAKEGKIGELVSKDNQVIGKIWKDIEIIPEYLDSREGLNQMWRIRMTDKSGIQANVEVRQMPEMQVAYVRHIGSYKGDSELFERLFTKLMTWAGPRGLLRFPQTQMLTVYYDDPDITMDDKLRVDACISVPEDTVADGEIGRMTIQGGTYAVAHFELRTDEYEDAWNAVFGGWLPQSGYQPCDGPCYELYLNNPKEHPEGKCVVDICVPVKPL